MPKTPPLPRILRLGSKGRDVRAVQRALRAAGVRKEPRQSNAFDAATKEEVEEFQRAQKLHIDGEVGKHTYAALAEFLDDRALTLLDRVAGAKPHTIRQQIAAAAFCGYNNRESVHYTQGSQRMEGVREELHPPKFPHFEDCSSFVTWCYFAAGAPDPNGRGYDGTGFSGTLVQHGKQASDPAMGDIAFYGHSHTDINHVTVCVGNGRVVSHGQESGPMLYPLNYNRGSSGGLQFVKTYPL
jgi:cell wall-associated NlpC family hydrolase